MRCADLNPQTDQSELARRVGGTLKAQSISSILRGEQATSKYTPRIAFVLGCDATWLADGDGKPPRMHKHDSGISDASINDPNTREIVKSPASVAARMVNEPASSQGSKISGGRASVSARPIVAWDREEELGDEYVLIPRLDVKFSAGNGKIVWHVDEKGQKQAFRRAWCLRLGINPEHAATIVNEGQSMESRIQDGDSLVVDYKATRIIDGKVFALAYRDELYVKRLFKLPSGGLIVRSDNPDKARFPDINLSAEDMEFVEIIAQVKGVSGGV